MTVKKEFEFDFLEDTWSGAKDRMEDLTDDLLNELEGILESDPEGIFGEEIPDETAVNDFLWFEDDTYAEWLGFDSSDQMWKYCELVNKGVDEDEIWIDAENPDKLITSQDIIDRFELFKSENPDWEEEYGYNDWLDFAEDYDYASFERNN